MALELLFFFLTLFSFYQCNSFFFFVTCTQSQAQKKHTWTWKLKIQKKIAHLSRNHSCVKQLKNFFLLLQTWNCIQAKTFFFCFFSVNYSQQTANKVKAKENKNNIFLRHIFPLNKHESSHPGNSTWNNFILTDWICADWYFFLFVGQESKSRVFIQSHVNDKTVSTYKTLRQKDLVRRNTFCSILHLRVNNLSNSRTTLFHFSPSLGWTVGNMWWLAFHICHIFLSKDTYC